MNWELLFVIAGLIVIISLISRFYIKYIKTHGEETGWHNIGRSYGDAYWYDRNRPDND